MSADNYYVVRLHPKGGYAAVMGFASDDSHAWDDVPVNESDQQFPTVEAALQYAEEDYTEYGVSVHEECREGWKNERLDPILDIIDEAYKEGLKDARWGYGFDRDVYRAKLENI